MTRRPGPLRSLCPVPPSMTPRMRMALWARTRQLRIAPGVAGVTAERRGEPLVTVARMLQEVAPRVGISCVGAWARGSIRSSLSFFSSSPWPPALVDKGFYLGMLRALHDPGARVSFFTGDANQRLRILRTRSEGFIASLPAFSVVAGSAKKAMAYDLAVQLACWLCGLTPAVTSLLLSPGALLIASFPITSQCSRWRSATRWRLPPRSLATLMLALPSLVRGWCVFRWRGCWSGWGRWRRLWGACPCRRSGRRCQWTEGFGAARSSFNARYRGVRLP